MSNAVKQIETVVASLSDTDLRAFRAWFQKFDAARWDEQLARNVQAASNFWKKPPGTRPFTLNEWFIFTK